MAKLRTLDYYGFSNDNTMYKAFKTDPMGIFAISKAKEYKNKKYIKPVDDEGGEESGTTENNQ